jgi:hypothetical protein
MDYLSNWRSLNRFKISIVLILSLLKVSLDSVESGSKNGEEAL